MSKPKTEPSSMAVPTESITVADLADELHVRRQTIFKVLRRLSIRPTQRRESTRGNQKVAVIAVSAAILVRNELSRVRKGSPPGDNVGADESSQIHDEVGVFYLVQLEPEHDPGRFKVGFTTDMDGRLRKHRCAAPFARVEKTWPCRRVWERAGIDCVTAESEQIHTEVFRTASLNSILERANQFFSIMPRAAVQRESLNDQSSDRSD